MMTPGSGVLDLGFSHPAPAPLQSQQPKSAADDAIGAQQGFADQTVGMDLTPPFQGRSNGGGGGGGGALTLNGLDWPATVDPTLFDLSGAVDHWNPSHWGDTDPSLYLP
uniref:Uncharacterized protein n=1 Tax=Ananas comosus var. bracteatus TaxID=296719 RepID=A0A6V7QVT5_ANACO